MTFADYATYLESSVAINLLFGIWRVLWQNFGGRMNAFFQKRFVQLKDQARNLAKTSDTVLPQLLTETHLKFST